MVKSSACKDLFACRMCDELTAMARASENPEKGQTTTAVAARSLAIPSLCMYPRSVSFSMRREEELARPFTPAAKSACYYEQH